MAIGIGIGIGIPSGALNSNAAGIAAAYYYYSLNFPGIGEDNLSIQFEFDANGLPILNNSNIYAAVGAYTNGELEDIELWDVSNVTSMRALFRNATAFNQDIGNWDVSNVTDMSFMFSYATSFNQDISSWDVSNVSGMNYMFNNATSFNQDISSWDVSSVIYMDSMFYNASSFNQDLNSWDTSSLTSVGFMFYDATSFNQPIGNWDVTNFNSEYNGYFMGGVTLSTSNYDNLLIGWAAQMLIEYPGGSGYTIAPSWSFGNSVHTIGSDAESAKNTLINTFNWTITDAN